MESRWQKALVATRQLDPSPKNIERIAAEFGADLGRWAFLQWTLRERAETKFERAAEMLFDRPGLEMASDERIAAYHASCFPEGVQVADLTCGIGADLIALCRHGPTVGFELDADRAAYARHNLAVHGVSADVPVSDSLTAEWDFEYAFADPARRTESARSWNPDEFSPHPVRLGERLRKLKLAGMKLSPMIRDDFFRHLPGRLEFVSFQGECREALVWMGSEAGEGRWAVQVVGTAPERSRTGRLIDAASAPQQRRFERIQAIDETAERRESASEFLFEADPAAIRADALPAIASPLGLSLLADSNGYLTGPDPVASPWLTSYRVFQDHPAALRRTAQALRDLGAGTPIVKSRVPRFDVDQLRRQLRGEGRELIVAVYPNGKQIRHAIVERL